MTTKEREADEQFAGTLLKWIINNDLVDKAMERLDTGADEKADSDESELNSLIHSVIFKIPPEKFLGFLAYSRKTYHWIEESTEYEPFVETLHQYEAALRKELAWAVEEKKRRIALLASATDGTTEET